MDPNATYREFMEAVAAGDNPAAVAAGETLERWMRRGGFAPMGFHALWFARELRAARKRKGAA